MILSNEDIEKAKLAGQIAGKALAYGKSLIKPDERIVDILDKVEEYILKNGGGIAFPAQVALNDTAAHYCPLGDDMSVFKEDDIIKLDVGVHVDGFIGDNATTIIFSGHEEYETYENIKKASEDALHHALEIIRPGATLGEIGMMIQESIAHYDLSPIKNLSGHGLGQYHVHENPTIPNFDTRDNTELKENQHIAIEPFATNGHGMIYESNNPTLFSLEQVRPVRSMHAREVLKDIQEFQKLPFTTRWLTRKHSLAKVRLALRELQAVGSIHAYAPLIETKHGLVSQSEHTVIVREKPIITTKIDEF